mmetsp:Transcript_28390/g.74942  ORF Transcript_28390/g.74942 Transcript_28390/m.74942 type:complete len:256 (-) Transcript_28390:819-1586(-)
MAISCSRARCATIDQRARCSVSPREYHFDSIRWTSTSEEGLPWRWISRNTNRGEGIRADSTASCSCNAHTCGQLRFGARPSSAVPTASSPLFKMLHRSSSMSSSSLRSFSCSAVGRSISGHRPYLQSTSSTAVGSAAINRHSSSKATRMAGSRAALYRVHAFLHPSPGRARVGRVSWGLLVSEGPLVSLVRSGAPLAATDSPHRPCPVAVPQAQPMHLSLARTTTTPPPARPQDSAVSMGPRVRPSVEKQCSPHK